MRTVSQAQQDIIAQTRKLPVARMPIEEALGLTLGTSVVSDIDSPACDKSLVDGYAIQVEDIAAGTKEFEVVEQVIAGMMPSRAVTSGLAAQIMTGVAVPSGATGVVKVEDTTRVSDNQVVIHVDRCSAGQNILRRAVSMRTGDVVLVPGHQLRAYEVGVLAEVGVSQVEVVRRPMAAIVSTGNELVPVSQRPGPGQLRNSNGPMLRAQASQSGAHCFDLGIARDNEDELRSKLREGLTRDVLIVSGGVSAGVMDLVPKVLNELGVRQVFHKVHLKPGKPIWFGVHDRPDQPEVNDRQEGSAEKTKSSRRALVFGLPGNPVSSLVCFELFVRLAIEQMMGIGNRELAVVSAVLDHEFTHRGDRPTYFPSRVELRDGQFRVRLLPWQGSADLRVLSQANGLAQFEAGDKQFVKGDVLPVRLLA